MERSEEQEFYHDDDEAIFVTPSGCLALFVQRKWPRDAVLVQKEG